MCGIAGVVHSEAPVARRVVEAQLRTLDHRGPDSSGIFFGSRAAVGQTRLAIIDLSTGDPPIANEHGSVGVALNGEIYNFRELRKELLNEGHTFATECDTEVLAHLAEDVDPMELAARLEGMFAFAVWDERRGRLLLGRDRLGKKPLYYWKDDDHLVFGSEIKAVTAHPRVPKRLDVDALPGYLTFGYVPTPRTFFEEIRSVPPGHVLVVERDMSVQLESYWRPAVPGMDGVSSLDIDLSEAAGEVRRLLEAAVERRLISDVPLGAFLSGGIDSSTVVGIMSTFSTEPVRTFTIGFEDREGFDERPYARQVAERFGTDHTEFVVRPNAVDVVEQLVWHYDQPFGDSSAIPTFMLSQETKREITVALSGDGGDELFAGYERFAAAVALAGYERLPSTLRRPLERVVGLFPDGGFRGRVASFRRFAARAGMGLPGAFSSWLSYVDESRRSRLIPDGSDWAGDDYRRVWEESEGASLLDRLLHLSLRTYLLDDLLPKVDRMSMAHALEVRSPLLDRELLEFAFRLPPNLKFGRFSLKRVLRAVVRDLLPPAILMRRKRGFGVPLDRWFRSDLTPYVQAMLGSPHARVRAHLTPLEIDRLLGEHHERAADHGHALWALLTLELFLRREGW